MQNRVQSGDVVTTDETLAGTAFSAFEMGINDDAHISYAVELRHKLTSLPRVIYTKRSLLGEGSATATRNINFIDTVITPDSATQSKFDLSHTDITFYYPIVSSWIALDAGVTKRSMDGKIAIDALVIPEDDGTGTGTTAPTAATPSTKVSKNITLLYINSTVQFPETDMAVNYVVNYSNSGSAHYSDMSLHISYAMEGRDYDYFFYAGYKKMKFFDNDFGEVSSSLEVAGPFITIGVGL